MKKLTLLVLGFTTMGLLAAATASAQANSASTSANANARVVTPISIAKTADMNFGDVVAGGSAGTVVLTPAGARSATGGTTLGSGTSVAAAAFNVTGQANATYAITLPASATVTSGANSMTVDTFTSNPSGTGTLSGGGSQALSVGATLNVGASQATGTYTGSFNVTVTYN
jgi:hypothetical protein